MDDDFNTANAISILFELSKEANLYLQEPNSSKEILELFLEHFADFGSVLGISLKEEKALLDEDVDQLIEERNEARKQRDFRRADEIRDELKNQGILLEDTPQGVRWKRM